MNRTLLVTSVVVLVALAGCSAFTGGPSGDDVDGVEVSDGGAGATNVTHSIAIEVSDETDGEELTHVGATYPREDFVVESAQHDAIVVGVDTNADGERERTFTASNVSGVNNNAYSFDVTLDTDYALESGDVVTIDYPAVSNPSDPGEYTVEVVVNERQRANETVTIE